jgi:hypothetical protein
MNRVKRKIDLVAIGDKKRQLIIETTEPETNETTSRVVWLLFNIYILIPHTSITSYLPDLAKYCQMLPNIAEF